MHVLKKRKRLHNQIVGGRKSSHKAQAPLEEEIEERPTKKLKRAERLEDLPWKQVKQSGGGFETDGVMLMVEEVDDVEVVYDKKPDGQKAVSYKLKVNRLIRIFPPART